MSGQCDRDIDQYIIEVLSHAVPRLDERRSREMRGRLLASVRGGESSYPGFLAKRAIALLVATATMLGSMSVAAAVAKPGQPAYSLRTAFVAVRRAILPSPTGTDRTKASATHRPEGVSRAVHSQQLPATLPRDNVETRAGANARKPLRHLEDAWRPKAQARHKGVRDDSKAAAARSKRVGGHTRAVRRRGFGSKP